MPGSSRGRRGCQEDSVRAACQPPRQPAPDSGRDPSSSAHGSYWDNVWQTEIKNTKSKTLIFG